MFNRLITKCVILVLLLNIMLVPLTFASNNSEWYTDYIPKNLKDSVESGIISANDKVSVADFESLTEMKSKSNNKVTRLDALKYVGKTILNETYTTSSSKIEAMGIDLRENFISGYLEDSKNKRDIEDIKTFDNFTNLELMYVLASIEFNIMVGKTDDAGISKLYISDTLTNAELWAVNYRVKNYVSKLKKKKDLDNFKNIISYTKYTESKGLVEDKGTVYTDKVIEGIATQLTSNSSGFLIDINADFKQNFLASLTSINLGEKPILSLELPKSTKAEREQAMLIQAKVVDLVAKNESNFINGLVDLKVDLYTNTDAERKVNSYGKNVLIPLVQALDSSSKDQLLTLEDIDEKFNQVIPFYTLSPLKSTKAVTLNTIGELQMYLASKYIRKQLGYSEVDTKLLSGIPIFVDLYGNLIVKLPKPIISDETTFSGGFPTYLTIKDKQKIKDALQNVESDEFEPFELQSGFKIQDKFMLNDNRLYYDYYRILPWWMNLESIKGDVPYVGEIFTSMYKNLKLKDIDGYFVNEFVDAFDDSPPLKYGDNFYTIMYEVGKGIIYERLMIPVGSINNKGEEIYTLVDFRKSSILDGPKEVTQENLLSSTLFFKYFINSKEILKNYQCTKIEANLFNTSNLYHTSLNYTEDITAGSINNLGIDYKLLAYVDSYSYCANSMHPSLTNEITLNVLNELSVSNLEKEIAQKSISFSMSILIILYFLVILWVALLILAGVLEKMIPLPLVYLISFRLISRNSEDNFVSRMIWIELFLIFMFMLISTQALPQIFAKLWFFFKH